MSLNTSAIFVGPSAPVVEVKRYLPDSVVCPPVRRGDLHRAREAGVRSFLIIDGVFTHSLAVSPREVIDVICDGATVVGASSMGALRAAECWPVGMRGVGIVYRLFRRGWLDSDDEVAVTTDADREYRATSVALINIRAAMSRARRRGLVAESAAHDVIATARETYYPDRQWSDLLRKTGLASRHELLAFVLRADLKGDDARLALRTFSSVVPGLTVKGPPGRFERPLRAPGMDWTLGMSPGERGDSLLRWLVGSGRYRRHIWAVVAGEPELAGDGLPCREPAMMRERLAACLARLLDSAPELVRALELELSFEDELHAELTRMFAVRQTAEHARSLGVAAGPALRRAVRDEIAAAHGAFDWEGLQTAVTDGRLWGVIPVEWIDTVAEDLACARAAREVRRARP